MYLLLYLVFRIFCKLKKTYVAKIPIISVGNITTGGTGKTPFVSWLINFLNKEGFSPIVITRGYKSKGEGIRLLIGEQKQTKDAIFYGDEVVMLSNLHPKTPIIVSPDRIASLKQYSHLGDIAILEDGMQQFKIKKNLDIGMIDALSGFGNGKLFPVGSLREPLSQQKRNDFFLLSSYNLQKNKIFIAKILTMLPVNKSYYELGLVAQSLISSKSGLSYSLKKLPGKAIILFSGIANPRGFQCLVEQVNKGVKVFKTFNFTDHFHYKLENLAPIFEQTSKADKIFVTTQKDYTKLLSLQKQLPEFFILTTKLAVPQALTKKLRGFLQKIKK